MPKSCTNTQSSTTPNDEWKQITYDEWHKTYHPTTEDALEDFPKGTSAEFLWTEIESDGHWTIASGNHFVNRTGRYYITKKPHNFMVDVNDE